MTQDSVAPHQGREQELAYIGSWAEQSDFSQQSVWGCMNSDSSGSTSDKRDRSASHTEETNQNDLNGKGDEHGENHTPLERYIAQAASDDAWFPRKGLRNANPSDPGALTIESASTSYQNLNKLLRSSLQAEPLLIPLAEDVDGGDVE